MIRSLITVLLAALAFSASAAVDVNQASRAELEAVKGIGPGLSAKILAARQQARFKDWPDLVQRVSGLGERNARRISSAGLTVAGAAYGPAKAAAPANAAKPVDAARKPAATAPQRSQ